MQHHGCPKRLLDFTTNPLVGLFFAVQHQPKRAGEDKEPDGVIHIATYSQKREPKPGDPWNSPADFVYYPSHITARVIGQAGCFVVCKQPWEPLESKVIEPLKIPAPHKEDYRRALRQLGVTSSTLFPGLDGVCAALKAALLDQLDLDSRESIQRFRLSAESHLNFCRFPAFSSGDRSMNEVIARESTIYSGLRLFGGVAAFYWTGSSD